MTAAVEVCPHCDSENLYENWDVKTQGYIAVCQTCGREIMLCDECFHTDANGDPCDCHQDCDWVYDPATDTVTCYRMKFIRRNAND